MNRHNSDNNIHLYDKQYFLEMESGHNDFLKNRVPERFARILDLISFNKTDRVLDLGAGRGEMGIVLQDKVKKIILSDYADGALEIMQAHVGHLSNVEIKKLNAKSIPYPAEYFDKVFLLDVLEHLYYNEALLVLKEIKRALKKDGILVLSTAPNKYLSFPQYFIAKKFFKLELKGQKYHLNEYSFFSLKKTIQQFFPNFKIYCWEEKMWFFNVIKDLNLPKWLKKSVFEMNKIYDSKIFSYLRDKTFLRKFFAQCFLAIAKNSLNYL